MAKVRPSRKVGGKSTEKAAKEKRGRRGVASKPKVTKVTKGRRSPLIVAHAENPVVAETRSPAARRAVTPAVVPVVEVPQTPPPLPAPIASFVF